MKTTWGDVGALDGFWEIQSDVVIEIMLREAGVVIVSGGAGYLGGLFGGAARRPKILGGALLALTLVGLALGYNSPGAVAQSTPLPSNPLPALPSVTIVRGTLISPTDANAWYMSQTQAATDGLCQRYPNNPDICPTTTRPRAPEVRELARALKHDPNLIYEYVRNSVDTEFLFGSHKGSLGVIIDGSGTAFDQAQLMVDLLRETKEDGSPGYNA
ncbi:MAG: hypothetical protein Q7T59_04770, partial [Candidatus Woesebacteria bacterium]|nr:hypothetical protein [Candidatus Woesebacteria bacterium]